jgi:hypothetical protein
MQKGNSRGKEIKIIFFGDNKIYVQFINEVDQMIKEEFSKVE